MQTFRSRCLALCLLLPLLCQPAFSQDDDDDGYDDIVDLGQVVPDFTDLTQINAPSSASAGGFWSPAARWPIVAIHSALLPDGKVLTYGTSELAEGGLGFVYDVWDPAKGLAPNSHTTLDVQTGNNLFCSAQTLIPGSGGLMLITGGSVAIGGARNFGTRQVNIFDPVNQSFYHPQREMLKPRWYPTVTVLGDGRVLVQGGRDSNKNPTYAPEIFDPQTGEWSLLQGARSTSLYGNAGWNYPRALAAPNGKVLVSAANKRYVYYFDPAGTGSVTPTRSMTVTVRPTNNLLVMYEAWKALSVRGPDARRLTFRDDDVVKSANIGDMSGDRFWADATVLADGEVLVTGGSRRNQALGHAVNEVEFWNPNTETWRFGAAGEKARLYHSTSLLLPNGTVLVAGGGPPGPTANLNAEVYYPPYLFNPNGSLRQRPRIVGEIRSRGPLLKVRARGDEGAEELELRILGEVVATFDLTQSYRVFSYRHDRPVRGDQVEVAFVNDEYRPEDNFDANAKLDYLQISGVRHDAEDPRTFVVHGSESGYLEMDFFVRNGSWRFFDQTEGYLDLGTVAHGEEIELSFDQDSGGIREARLVRFGSATHSFDMGQRAMTIDHSTSGGDITLTIPNNPNIAIPGHYLLFIVDNSGTPSEAAIVEVQ